MKIIISLLAFLPLLCLAEDISQTPAITSEANLKDDRDFNPRKSHWLTTLGWETVPYKVPYTAFTGRERSFGRPKNQYLSGARLGLGGELYLGAGFMTSTRVDGYYLGTLFASKRKVDDTSAPSDNFKKSVGQIYGADVSQTLSFLFDFKTKNPIMDEWSYLTIEPFIEAGFGYARAFNKTEYRTADSDNNQLDSYQNIVQDELLHQRWGGGVNLLANSGFFLYLKAMQNHYNVTQRHMSGYTQSVGASAVPFNTSSGQESLKITTIYSFGGGYKF